MQALTVHTNLLLKDSINFAFYHYFRKGSSKVVFIIFFFAFLYFLMIYSSHLDDTFILLRAFYLFLIYLFIPGVIYFQARKTFLSDKKFSQPIQWDFDIEGAASKGFGFAISFTWNSILNVTESKDAFLIYHSNRTANIIPKRDLSPLEISHFQQLIKSIPGLKSELWLRQKGASEVAFIPATRIQRFLNFVLDLLFFLLLFGIFIFGGLILYIKILPEDADIDPLVSLIPYFLILPFYSLYYFVSEYFFYRTLAQRITKTKVVSVTEAPIRLKQILLRSLARIIPCEGASYIVSEVGIHDLLSKTLVIRSGNSK